MVQIVKLLIMQPSLVSCNILPPVYQTSLGMSFTPTSNQRRPTVTGCGLVIRGCIISERLHCLLSCPPSSGTLSPRVKTAGSTRIQFLGLNILFEPKKDTLSDKFRILHIIFFISWGEAESTWYVGN
jgi:hypothetical protein